MNQNRKKIFLKSAFLAILLFLTLSKSIFAATKTSKLALYLKQPHASDAAEIRREEINEAKEQFVERRELRHENHEVTRAEIKLDIIINHKNRLNRRYQFYTQRLEKISKKIEDRFNELENKEFDLTLAQQELGLAKTSLEQAQAAAEQVINLLEQVAKESEENRFQLFEEAKEMDKEVRDSYKEALSSLKEAVKLAKEQVID